MSWKGNVLKCFLWLCAISLCLICLLPSGLSAFSLFPQRFPSFLAKRSLLQDLKQLLAIRTVADPLGVVNLLSESWRRLWRDRRGVKPLPFFCYNGTLKSWWCFFWALPIKNFELFFEKKIKFFLCFWEIVIFFNVTFWKAWRLRICHVFDCLLLQKNGLLWSRDSCYGCDNVPLD